MSNAGRIGTFLHVAGKFWGLREKSRAILTVFFIIKTCEKVWQVPRDTASVQRSGTIPLKLIYFEKGSYLR